MLLETLEGAILLLWYEQGGASLEILRIYSYNDSRFSQNVLNQHGAYLVDGEPFEVEISGPDSAILRGSRQDAFLELIEFFRFHAPHITKFYDEIGRLVASFPDVERICIPLDTIQPSQFYVDRTKLNAVGSFLSKAEDIVIQVLPWEDRFIALDGHTRLFWALRRGIKQVYAVVSESDEWVWSFVNEAKARGISTPGDMKLLEHEEYVLLWDRYCDAQFAGREGDTE